LDLLPAIIPSMAAEYIFDIGNGLLIAQHPSTGLIVRSDGAVFAPKKGSRHKQWHWTYGSPVEGYLRVRFNRRLYRVHRLVAETFIDNPENKPAVDHWDWNKQNNSVENLRWVTGKENEANKCRALNCLRKYGVRAIHSDKETFKEYARKRYAEKSKDPEWVEKERARNRGRRRLKRAKEKGQSCD